MGFFREMSFPRSVILVSVLASGVLGWFVWTGSQRLTEVKQEVRRAPGEVTKIQEMALSVEDLNRVKSGEGIIKNQNDVDLYIRSIAKERVVAIGQVEVANATRNVNRDVEDVVYTIRPADRKEDFGRLNIGNFLYKLEADSKRVKVTHIKIEPAKRLKPGEIGDDRWTYDIGVTTRQRVGS